MPGVRWTAPIRRTPSIRQRDVCARVDLFGSGRSIASSVPASRESRGRMGLSNAAASGVPVPLGLLCDGTSMSCRGGPARVRRAADGEATATAAGPVRVGGSDRRWLSPFRGRR